MPPQISKTRRKKPGKQKLANTSPRRPPIRDQLSAGTGQANPVTPRRGLTDGGAEKQTNLRSEIGDATESEIVECDPEDFRSHYLPFVPKADDVDNCLKAMVKMRMLEKGFDKRRAEDKRSPWTANFWPMKPSENTRNESEAFDQQMTQVFECVRDRNIEGRSTNGFRFRACGNNPLSSTMEGANFKSDAIFTASPTGEIHVLDIAFPFEFKLIRNSKELRDNRLKVTGACIHILNEDVRRMFVYGVTIEDNRMTIWYFSRTHSAKSQSFDYLKNPGLMVAVLLSLVHATDQELGYDPLIHLHRGPESWNFVYEFPAKATNEEEEQSPTWYKVLNSIFEIRQLRPTGRTTRVWKVVEVEGKNDIQEKPEARQRVLKDVWLPTDAPTEGEIQEALFKDIEEFAKGEWRANERLSAFSDDDKNEFAPLLKDEGYKELFLCVKQEHAGEPCRARCSTAWKPGVVYLPSFEDTRVSQVYGTLPRTSMNMVPGDKPKAPVKGTSAPGLGKRNPCREFSPKRRCFFIYDDICTPIDQLSNLGECVKVLGGCVLALRLMYCAGWVHRDISTGNVLAYRSDPEGAWTAKLSDLEYAKRFPPSPGSSDPKTGTPYFLPLEISMQCTISKLMRKPPQMVQQRGQKNFFRPLPKMPDQPPNPNLHLDPIQHNFQHDLESTWWILLYLISCLTDHQDSRILVATVFIKNPTATIDRELMLLLSLEDHYPKFRQDLQRLLPAIDELRASLISEYFGRTDPRNLASYSDIHYSMACFFNQANTPELAKEWDKILLRKEQSNPFALRLTVGEPERVALDKNRTTKRERYLPKLKRTRLVDDVGGPDEDLPRRNPMRSVRGKVGGSDDGGRGASTSERGLKRNRKNH